jgi:hypothetical protein
MQRELVAARAREADLADDRDALAVGGERQGIGAPRRA